MYAKPPSAPDAVRVSAIAAKLRALPLPLGAVRCEPNGRGFIWVAQVFAYANTTGDEFADTLKKLIGKKQVMDLDKDVQQVVREAS